MDWEGSGCSLKCDWMGWASSPLFGQRCAHAPMHQLYMRRVTSTECYLFYQNPQTKSLTENSRKSSRLKYFGQELRKRPPLFTKYEAHQEQGWEGLLPSLFCLYGVHEAQRIETSFGVSVFMGILSEASRTAGNNEVRNWERANKPCSKKSPTSVLQTFVKDQDSGQLRR